MGDANAVYDMSRSLQLLLEKHVSSPDGPVKITTESPLRENHEEPRINLYLYAVTPDPRRNSVRVETQTTEVIDPITGQRRRVQGFAPEPLAVNFHYLVTAYAQEGADEQRLLGQLMQTFHTYQYIPEDYLYGTVKESGSRPSRYQLVLESMPLETLHQLWGSSTQMRTSLAYQVSVVFIDSLEAGTSASYPNKDGRVIQAGGMPILKFIAPDRAPVGATVRLYGSHFIQVHKEEPEPDVSYLKVWFGDVVTTPAQIKDRVLEVVVPEGLTVGMTQVKVQLDQFYSSTRPFEVEETSL